MAPSRATRKRAIVIALLAGAVVVAPYFLVRPDLRGDADYSRAVRARGGELLRLTLSRDEKYRLPLDARETPSLLREATLLYEDQYYLEHGGVNFAALARAFRATYLSSGPRVGGSTLSMQVARLRYRLDTRRVPGKLLQIAAALWLEQHYTKAEILQAYFNLAPYGRNIEGARAAALVYFGKEPAALDLNESLALAIIPQNPNRRALPAASPEIETELSARRLALLERWVAIHGDDRAWEARVKLPTSARTLRELPFLAPHFVERKLVRAADLEEERTTLDLGLQRSLERQLELHLANLRDVGVKNGAAILLDHEKDEVVAWVGSADYFDAAISGQVDGVTARRSPGSALKPFIYALALDQGLIHPRTVLHDTPRSFGQFNPENFDREFAGPLSATEALARSRNLPAVNLAAELKNPSFYEFLTTAGIGELRSEKHYGLASVLGAVEVTLEELVRLYAKLAREELPPISREAARLTGDMLSEHALPGWRSPIRVAWKTGTSYGFRDALTAGSFGQYSLVVWLGNFDGAGNPALVGRDVAAPLFFKMVDAIRPRIRERPPETLASLRTVKICPISGKVPGPHCRHTVETRFIAGRSPIETCDVHRAILVDPLSRLRACEGVPGSLARARAEVFEFWPTDVLKVFASGGVARRAPPPPDPRCSLETRSREGNAPRILIPTETLDYVTTVAGAADASIPLQAVADSDARGLFWFMDDGFAGKAKPGQALAWTMSPGEHVVRVVDDQGRATSRAFKVKLERGP